jgi:hypothetical protein
MQVRRSIDLRHRAPGVRPASHVVGEEALARGLGAAAGAKHIREPPRERRVQHGGHAIALGGGRPLGVHRAVRLGNGARTRAGHQRADVLRVAQRQSLRDHAPERDPDHGARREFPLHEQRMHVVGEILEPLRGRHNRRSPVSARIGAQNRWRRSAPRRRLQERQVSPTDGAARVDGARPR